MHSPVAHNRFHRKWPIQCRRPPIKSRWHSNGQASKTNAHPWLGHFLFGYQPHRIPADHKRAAREGHSLRGDGGGFRGGGVTGKLWEVLGGQAGAVARDVDDVDDVDDDGGGQLGVAGGLVDGHGGGDEDGDGNKDDDHNHHQGAQVALQPVEQHLDARGLTGAEGPDAKVNVQDNGLQRHAQSSGVCGSYSLKQQYWTGAWCLGWGRVMFG